jgi:hypothetical protein
MVSLLILDKESDCADVTIEKKRKMNDVKNPERSVARDDGFCTGADFIKQKYVYLCFSVSNDKIL